MKTIYIIWILYLLIINIAGFLIMGIDKKRAKMRTWRIEEKTLFFIAVVGGSVGSILGMQIFRHKTRHKSFTLGMPFIVFIQLIIAWKIF